MSLSCNDCDDDEHILLWAINMKDFNQVQQMILKKRRTASKLNNSLEYSVALGQYRMIEFILAHMPDQKHIDRLFRSAAVQGVDPKLILLLQQAASPSEVIEQQRYNVRLKKDGSLKQNGHYIISLIEPHSIRDMHHQVDTFYRQLQSPLKHIKYEAILRSQSWINGLLLDGVFCNNKLLVHEILTLARDVRPQRNSIKDALIIALKDRNFTLATMLLSNGDDLIFIDGTTFDEVFSYFAEKSDVVAMKWMLRGLFGFVPSPALLDELYEVTSLQESPSHQPFLQLIENRVSTDVLLRVRGELHRRADRRARMFRRMQPFSARDPEIHSYSAVSVNSSTGSSSGATSGAVAPESAVHNRAMDAGTVGGTDHTHIGNSPTHLANTRTSLNEAIWASIQRRVAGLQQIRSDRVYEAIVNLIQRAFESDGAQDVAIDTLRRILAPEVLESLALTLTFLSTLPNPEEAHVIWIQGFLGESVSARSCNPGAVERIVTGLRGIEDAELSRIFSQAEGPQLASIFLIGTFNVFYGDSNDRAKEKAVANAQTLAQEIVARGVTLQSTPEQVRVALLQYAVDTVATIGVEFGRVNARGAVDSIVDSVVDGYEDYLLQFVCLFCGELQEDGSESGAALGSEEEEDPTSPGPSSSSSLSSLTSSKVGASERDSCNENPA